MQKEKVKIEYKYKLCPVCSFFCNINEQDKFCSFCGSQLIEACPECGEAIANPYAKFCKYCGKNYPGRNTKGNLE